MSLHRFVSCCLLVAIATLAAGCATPVAAPPSAPRRAVEVVAQALAEVDDALQRGELRLARCILVHALLGAEDPALRASLLRRLAVVRSELADARPGARRLAGGAPGFDEVARRLLERERGAAGGRLVQALPVRSAFASSR